MFIFSLTRPPIFVFSAIYLFLETQPIVIIVIIMNDILDKYKESNISSLFNTNVVQFKSQFVQILIGLLVFSDQFLNLGNSSVLSLLMAFNFVS